MYGGGFTFSFPYFSDYGYVIYLRTLNVGFSCTDLGLGVK